MTEQGAAGPWIIGVDTGGTFTDFIALDGAGRATTHKVLSTPGDPGRAVVTGLDELLATLQAGGRTGPGDRVEAGGVWVVHGSTVATNALLERRGVSTGLVTTAGFADILELGRQDRPALYELGVERPQPLVPAQYRKTVTERVDAQGRIQRELDMDAAARVAKELHAAGVESVAVCLLFSFANPEHEQRLAAVLRGAGFFVSASCEVLPEYREYERTSTTVINAYVSPLMGRYLQRLQADLADRDTRELRVMQSNGGSISAERAGREAVHTVFSGPAGGVVGAGAVAWRAGIPNIITFDMGGTSTDVSLVPGRPIMTTEARINGLPLRVPTMDIHTMGAGGGSIAYVDAGGALRVGPESAGAQPGPAAYDQGGKDFTVTDANLALGRIVPGHFLGGRMRLDVEQARAAAKDLCATLDTTVEEVAWGVVQVVNSNMERALKVISVERGFDPREFTLVSFGGAGGLHACELARGLEIPRVLVPHHPGILSAYGMAAADVIKTYSKGILASLADGGLAAVREILPQLQVQAGEDLQREGSPPETIVLEPTVDLRYAGQSFELSVPVVADRLDSEILADAFHAAHREQYGYDMRPEVVEVVAVRLQATGGTGIGVGHHVVRRAGEGGVSADPRESLGDIRAAASTVVPTDLPEPVGVGHTRFAAGTVETPYYDRQSLTSGMVISGPVLVLEPHATLVLPPGDRLTVDPFGNLLIEVGAALA